MEAAGIRNVAGEATPNAGLNNGGNVPQIPDKQYFRPEEVAKFLDQPLRTIYYWLEKDKIKHLHYGRKTRIKREELERVMRDGV